ncbi:MAG: beta-lactamase family protein, partial [bacterium]|nr:beta-lactamase family protein [bacterium]
MNRITLLLILLALAGALLLTAAEEPPLATPESVGMSAERLERIGGWLGDMVKRKQAAGFVTLVARRGKVVHHQAHGTRGLEVAEPMPRNALFDIASMTKPVTAIAALMLLEEGRFTLGDPISDYLPEFKNPDVQIVPGTLRSAVREISVHHLLTHTSGVRDPRNRAETFAYAT